MPIIAAKTNARNGKSGTEKISWKSPIALTRIMKASQEITELITTINAGLIFSP